MCRQGYQVAKVIKEVGSGINESRPKLLALLEDQSLTLIVVEHQDRLTRFGFRYLETLLHGQGRAIEVVNLAENGTEDLLADLTSIIYTIQAISKPALKRGSIAPSGLPITVQTRYQNVDQVRIVPRKGYYVVEVVYERQVQPAPVDCALMVSIDIGVNNLAAITSNKVGFVPRIVNGRPPKSVNQYYNKRKAELQKRLGTTGTTNRMERMTTKRTRRIDHYMHTASKHIIDLLVAEGIGTLIIGKNPNWKQECEMRKKDKQHFVQLPHARFVDMLCYKAKLVGIQVVLQEESYTSKASFLDGDAIPTYGKEEGKPTFSGRRVERGLYKAKSGRKFNADVNGSLNILRKASPDAFGKGVEDGKGMRASLVVHPVRLPVRSSKSRIR